MSTITLLDGARMPAFGLGTWLSEPEAVYRAVRYAIEIGVRHIDGAWIYGNEEEVGRGVREAIAAGDATREQLWVTTKLWNDCHEPARVRPALERSLSLLGLDYVDLYLMHWPVALRPGIDRPKVGSELVSLDDVPLQTTWAAMVELPATGGTRRVGVSNFSASKLGTIADAVGVTPVVNQVELHPYLQQDALLEAMRARGIVATAYSPLGSGGRPASMRREAEVRLLDDPTVADIARTHATTPAAVLVAWALGRGTSVIPKSTHPERIAANFAARSLVLTPEQMTTLAALDRGERYVTGDFWCLPGSPYTPATLWG